MPFSRKFSRVYVVGYVPQSHILLVPSPTHPTRLHKQSDATLSSHSSPQLAGASLVPISVAFLAVIYCAVALPHRLLSPRVRASHSAASLQQQHKHASHAPRSMGPRRHAICNDNSAASARNKTSAAHPTPRHARQHRAELRRVSAEDGPEQRRNLGVRRHERRVDLSKNWNKI